MPNKDMVKGAEPQGRLYPCTAYKAESVIYQGDFVKRNANGTVERATAAGAILGVAMSNAVAGADVLVSDHPDQVFSIQADGSEISAQTAVGLNYDIVVGTADTVYKRSAMELASATGATTATLPLKVISIARDVDNAPGANVKCTVRINNHQNGQATGTAGV